MNEKRIEERGRTFDAVINPKDYPPFSPITSIEAFETAWENHPDWVLAHMSHAAYCQSEYIENLLSNFGASIEFFESKPDRYGIQRGRQAFLAIWEDKAILFFRGTEVEENLTLQLPEKIRSVAEKFKISLPEDIEIPFCPSDIIDDLSCISVECLGGGGVSQIHRGFLKATQELWPDIKKSLEKLPPKVSKQLFATGHSLGGAMATVSGTLHPFQRITTFGEPAVGGNIEKIFDPGCIHVRYVNGSDPVPRIVPESLFQHHGKFVEICDIDGPDIRYDHSILNYAIVLEDYVTQYDE